MRSKTIFIKIVISLLLIGFLFYKTDIALLRDIIFNADPFFVASAFVLYFITQVLSTYRWSILLHPDKFNLSYWRLLSFYFVGMFFNNFMPTTVGGDLMRCYYLFKESGKGGASVASVFVERYSGLSGMVFLLIVSTVIGYPLIKATPVFKISLLFISVYIIVSIFIWSRRPHEVLVNILDILSLVRLKERIESFTNALMEYRSTPKVLLKVLLLSIIIQMISIIIFYQLSEGLSLGLPLIFFFIFVPLAMMVALVPLTIAGLGVREGAFVYLFSTIGQSSAHALSLSMLWFSMIVVVSLWGGIEYIRIGKVGVDVSKAEEEMLTSRFDD